MALGTYTELRAAVTRAIARSDASTAIDEWIVMAEKELGKIFCRREMSVRATTATTDGVQFYSLPTDFGDAVDMFLTNDDYKKRLVPSDWARLTTRFQEDGEPCEWAITSNEFALSPIPDNAYTLELYYYRTIPPLSGNNETNWLLTAHPRLYLFAVLIQSVGFIDHPLQQAWAMSYHDALQTLKKDAAKERSFGGGPILRTDLPFGYPSASILTDE